MCVCVRVCVSVCVCGIKLCCCISTMSFVSTVISVERNVLFRKEENAMFFFMLFILIHLDIQQFFFCFQL